MALKDILGKAKEELRTRVQEARHKAGEKKAAKKVAKAKKKVGKSWTKAVKRQKKKGKAGETLSSLVSKRKGLKKGTAEYAAVQNKINKAYGVKKRHKATTPSPKKSEPIGQSYETAEASKPTSSEPPVPVSAEKPKEGEMSTMYRNKPKYSEGGKVESNPYGWPSRDARNGGNN